MLAQAWVLPGWGTKDGERFRKLLTSLALAWIWKHGGRSRFCAFGKEDDKLSLRYLESERSDGHP